MKTLPDAAITSKKYFVVRRFFQNPHQKPFTSRLQAWPDADITADVT